MWGKKKKATLASESDDQVKLDITTSSTEELDPIQQMLKAQREREQKLKQQQQEEEEEKESNLNPVQLMLKQQKQREEQLRLNTSNSDSNSRKKKLESRKSRRNVKDDDVKEEKEKPTFDTSNLTKSDSSHSLSSPASPNPYMR